MTLLFDSGSLNGTALHINERLILHEGAGVPPANAAVTGLYLLRKAVTKNAGVVVLQGSEVG